MSNIQNKKTEELRMNLHGQGLRHIHHQLFSDSQPNYYIIIYQVRKNTMLNTLGEKGM